jgi:hypothetical protein
MRRATVCPHNKDPGEEAPAEPEDLAEFRKDAPALDGRNRAAYEAVFLWRPARKIWLTGIEVKEDDVARGRGFSLFDPFWVPPDRGCRAPASGPLDRNLRCRGGCGLEIFTCAWWATEKTP